MLLTLVTAVVVVVVVASDMVGNGRPMTPTIAAARPPPLFPVAPAMHRPEMMHRVINFSPLLTYLVGLNNGM